MKFSSLFLLGCFILVSCDEMKGTLKVNEDLTLNGKKSEVKIPAGSHEAQISIKNKEKLELSLKLDKKDLKASFKIPKGTVLPQSEGEVEILSADSGQPYDLKAVVDTTYSSHDSDRIESCLLGYRRDVICNMLPPERTCRTIPAQAKECHMERAGRAGVLEVERCTEARPERVECETIPARRVCHENRIPIYGSQVVTYDNTISYKTVSVSLSAAGKETASFAHSSNSSSSRQTGASHCRPDGSRF